MNKTKEFLKLIGRTSRPSVDEIAGDEFLFNSYRAVFTDNNEPEAQKRRLARDTALKARGTDGKRNVRLKGNKNSPTKKITLKI